MTFRNSLFVAFVALILLAIAVEAKQDPHECNGATFSCMDEKNNIQCIPNSWRCDGFSDCYDNMDEADCIYEEKNCSANTNTEVVQCSATLCLSSNSPLLCNGIVDCRGYKGTYVYAEYGIDESPDYCYSDTTTTTIAYTSSMGWQPSRFSSWSPFNYTMRPLATLTPPPITQMTTKNDFWRNYCNRQVAINYCPRRCELHGMCTPLRFNPSRSELNKMGEDMNPPVVGPTVKTRSTSTTTTTTTAATTKSATTPSIKQRLLSDNLLERVLNDEGNTGNNGGFRPGNSLDGNNLKKRRDSNVDPDTMADTNTIYDWSDGERYAERSSSARGISTTLAWSLSVAFVTIISKFLLL